jgi:hypothetical protein
VAEIRSAAGQYVHAPKVVTVVLDAETGERW